MLRVFLFLSFLTLCFHSHACWIARGTFSIDGETFPLHQKFELKKDYVFPAGAYLLQIRLLSGEKKIHVRYVILEKKGTRLVNISKGEEEEIEPSKEREIFAKGLPGQPNSIITLTFQNI